ncbi:Protein of unknown function [Pyronema omphalodes CBS 100304]|uniref:Uncharacterized protein n=1 Tax=Pyronema omphalodes (strain CBS 100304) TaxID=1076935 RepID=U4LSN5_PYROM|nr:Protein of unknown function [Pyronema omphalodes CBS 100304]
MNINLVCLFDSRHSILTAGGLQNPIRGLCDPPIANGTGTWSGQFLLGRALDVNAKHKKHKKQKNDEGEKG